MNRSYWGHACDIWLSKSLKIILIFVLGFQGSRATHSKLLSIFFLLGRRIVLTIAPHRFPLTTVQFVLLLLIWHFPCLFFLFSPGWTCCSVRFPLVTGIALCVSGGQLLYWGRPFPDTNGQWRNSPMLTWWNSYTNGHTITSPAPPATAEDLLREIEKNLNL
jgi:hypothetical protein